MRLDRIIKENDQKEITKEFKNVYTYTPDNRGVMVRSIEIIFTKAPNGKVNVKQLNADFRDTTIKNLRTGDKTPMTVKPEQEKNLEKFFMFKLKIGELRSQNPKTDNILSYITNTDFENIGRTWDWTTAKPAREPIPDAPEEDTNLPGETPIYKAPPPATVKSDLFGLSEEEADAKREEVKASISSGSRLKLDTKYVDKVIIPGLPIRDPVTNKFKMQNKTENRIRKSGIYLDKMPDYSASVLERFLVPTSYLGMSLDGYLYEKKSGNRPSYYVGFGDYGVPNQYLLLRNNVNDGVQFIVDRSYGTFDKLFDVIFPQG